MTITFVTNYIHHHQIPIADEFFKILNTNYKYVALVELPDWLIKGGYDPSIERTYVIKSYLNSNNYNEAIHYINDSDVVIAGTAPEHLLKQRIESNKLTFRYTERWFKNKPWFLSGPKAYFNIYRFHKRYEHKPLYVLAASAFAANDMYSVGVYKNKIFKWGYFPDVTPIHFNNREAYNNPKCKILWCSRFIKWKHPEMPIYLAQMLKHENINFHIDMIGGGVEFERMKDLRKKLDVEDVVSFLGNIPNTKVLSEMRSHRIFLLTSDKNEGWGAVVNEAMSNGCTVVASNEIGSIPFLIKDFENGVIFKSRNIDSLYNRVKYLINNTEHCERMAINAYETIINIWNPKNAAYRLIELSKKLLVGESLSYSDGPCSKALPYIL